MLIRALIVLLLVLNLGVAAWWYWSAPASSTVDVDVPANVVRLQLVRERDSAAAGKTNKANASGGGGLAPAPAAVPAAAPADAQIPAPASAPDATAPTAAPTSAEGARCFSFGPFGSEDTLMAAQVTLKPLTQWLVVRRVPARGGRGWRVHLPPLPSAEEATAIAGRIAAAGFRDYFIVREGDEANSVALGRFATESAARRHAEALNAAGFAARAEPLGAGAGSAWVDVRAAADFDAAATRAQIGAEQQRRIDCAAVR